MIDIERQFSGLKFREEARTNLESSNDKPPYTIYGKIYTIFNPDARDIGRPGRQGGLGLAGQPTRPGFSASLLRALYLNQASCSLRFKNFQSAQSHSRPSRLPSCAYFLETSPFPRYSSSAIVHIDYTMRLHLLLSGLVVTLSSIAWAVPTPAEILGRCILAVAGEQCSQGATACTPDYYSSVSLISWSQQS